MKLLARLMPISIQNQLNIYVMAHDNMIKHIQNLSKVTISPGNKTNLIFLWMDNVLFDMV